MAESDAFKTVFVTLPEGAMRILDALTKEAIHGETRSEVARHLLITALIAANRRNL